MPSRREFAATMGAVVAGMLAKVERAEATMVALPYTRVFYGPDPRQLLDHYLPVGFPRPVHVVLVHGGGWASGDTEYGIMPGYASILAASGYTVSIVGYRLATVGRGWPTLTGDIVAGTMYAKAFLSAPTPTVFLGDSAGAHLAAMVAFSGAVKADGLIALYGAHNFQTLDTDTPGHPWSTQDAYRAALRACLGILPSEGNAGSLAAALGSPVYVALTTPVIVPSVLLVHSTDDPVIGVGQSRGMQAVLAGRVGISSVLHEIPGTAHGGAAFQGLPTLDWVMGMLAAIHP